MFILLNFQKTCAICLASMKPGQGHALFTAECSHTFHFHCIASNVKHGNQVCPVCRAKWKEIPFRGPPSSDSAHGRARVNPLNWAHAQDDGYMNILRRLPRADSSNRQQQHHLMPLFRDASEPCCFDDDEPLDSPSEAAAKESLTSCMKTVEIKAFPEFSEISQSAFEENFTILIHLKAPLAHTSSRAPVDLVTVLDVSGSMAGTKLAPSWHC